MPFWINQVLEYLVLLMALVIIFLTLFKWKRRDLFIQSSIWCFCIAMAIEIPTDIITQNTGGG